MKILVVKTRKLICSLIGIKRITPTHYGNFFLVLTIFLGVFFYIAYFSEPIYCSGPDPWSLRDRVDLINQSQKSQWQDLSNILRALANAELRRRSQIGATSAVVTLADLGVNWVFLGDTKFSTIPGLASLVTLRPDLFQHRANTNVNHIIAHIASDPSLS
jgi:hypothetical protein